MFSSSSLEKAQWSLGLERGESIVISPPPPSFENRKIKENI
jgi:hypothetical protein